MILRNLTEGDSTKQEVGIFDEVTNLKGSLRVADRIEIYLKIIADPAAMPRRTRSIGGKTKNKRRLQEEVAQR